MCAEETKDKGKKAGFAGCGCDPNDFQKFFEKFSGEFCGDEGFADCREIWKGFAEGCCRPGKEKDGE
jgi:hypothetical protein